MLSNSHQFHPSVNIDGYMSNDTVFSKNMRILHVWLLVCVINCNDGTRKTTPTKDIHNFNTVRKKELMFKTLDSKI